MPRKQLFIAIIGATLLICVASGTFMFLLVRRQQRQYPAATGPSVLITSPGPGDAALAAPAVVVQSLAYGSNPIDHVELWLDGEKVQSYENPSAGSPAPMEASFSQVLTEGRHLLFARAVDNNNLVGQSLPVEVTGVLAVEGQGPFNLITLQAGEGIDESLATAGADLISALRSNPGLDLGSAGPGAVIAVPVPPEDGGQAAAPASPVAEIVNPAPLEVTGIYPIGLPLAQLFPAFNLDPPAAPTALQASVAGCMINLIWNDASEQEAGFNVWITGVGVPPRIAARTAASAGNGGVSVELQAFREGSFVYWVEAYNSAGSQISNQASVNVTGPCPTGDGAQLLVEVLDFSGPAQIDRAYCYVSLQDFPEARMPAGQDQFIRVSGGNGNLASLPAAARSYKLAIPATPSLTLQGDCWGWAGDSLSRLGTFYQAILQTAWDGKRIPLASSIFEVGVTVSVAQPGGNVVPFAAPDPGFPAPLILALEQPISLGDVGLDPMEALDYLDRGNQRTLRWKWNSNGQGTNDITGFTILLNGIPFKQINSPQARSVQFDVPGFCGTKLDVSMVANAGELQSLPSNVVSDVQPACTLYALVDFESATFGWTNDTLNPANECDTMESYARISVSEIYDRGGTDETRGAVLSKSFNGGGFYQPIRCGNYDMNTIAGSTYTALEGNPTSFVLPIRVVEGHTTTYDIEATIWDWDEFGPNDVIGRYTGSMFFRSEMIEPLMAKMQGNPGVLSDFFCDSYTGIFDGDAKSRLDMCVDLYPTSPSSGATQLPSTAPQEGTQGSGIPPVVGSAFKPSIDLALMGTSIDQAGKLTVRLRNEGPDDLVGATINLLTTIQTDQPGVGSTPWITRRTGLNLASGAQMDLRVWPWDTLDTKAYSYTISVGLTAEGFSETNQGNNSVTSEYTASPLQTQPDPLRSDLAIGRITLDSKGNLLVSVANHGPDFLQYAQVSMICEAQQVARATGMSSMVTGLEASRQLNLNSGASADLQPITADFAFNLLTHWYLVSCQLKADGVIDTNQLNNFATVTLQ
jgi:hypothetical protein